MKIYLKSNFLVVSLLIVFSCFNARIAWSQGPNAPEAASFEPVDATDMVNLLTGDMTYVMPLISIPSPEGGYPIALTYHAGIGMDQEASWVGLGWNINPGSIDRGVNGYPDDWGAGLIVDRFYDAGGTETETSVRTSFTTYEGVSVAQSISFNSNKGFGGSVSVGLGFPIGQDGVGGNFGVGGTIGVRPGGKGYASLNGGYSSPHGFSIGGSIGTQGVGINAGSIGSGVGYNRSFQGNESFSVAFSTPGVSKIASVGLNFSSNGTSVSGNVGGTSVNQNIGFNQAASDSDYDVESKSSSFNIAVPTPAGIFGFGYNKQDVRWALNESKESFVSGPLYLSKAKGYNCRIIIVKEILVDDLPIQIEEYVDQVVDDPSECSCNLVNWQSEPYNGISCSVEVTTNHSYQNEYFMDIFEVGQDNSLHSLANNNASFPSYDNFNVTAQGLSGSMSPYLFQNGSLLGLGKKTLHDINGKYKLSYLLPASGNSQEDYTDFSRDIAFQFNGEFSSSLLIEPYNFEDGSANVIFDYLETTGTTIEPRKNSGRFVTYYTNQDILNNDIDGLIKTEGMNIPNNSLDGIGAFSITSLDGKTYHYSLPVYNHETITRTLDVVNKPERESYFESQQLKPYATHWLLTAITGPDYIDLNGNHKVDNDDYGYWVDFQYGKWSDAFVWKTPNDEDYIEDGLVNTRTVTHGRKQMFYLDRIKTRTHTALFIKNTRDDNKSVPWIYRAVETGAFPNPNTFDTRRFDIPQQKSLRLDQIILVKNEDDNLNKVDGSGLEVAQSVHIDYVENKEESAGYHLEDNVVDVKDDLSQISNRALKIVDFAPHYDYSLVDNAPNAIDGRLTLNGVSIKGKSGIKLIPSYVFEYDNTKTFNSDLEDDWGYHSEKAEVWSLNKIINPTGGIIDILFEDDTYSKTAIKNGRPINDGLKFSLLSAPECYQTGPVRLKVERETIDTNAPDIGNDFTTLFSTGEPVLFDFYEVSYTNVGGGDKDWGIINVPAGQATVLNVTSNFMTVEVNGTVYCRQGDVDDRNQLFEINPFSNLQSGSGFPFNKGLPRGHSSNYAPPNGSGSYYNVQYTIITNKYKTNEQGGGIRVKGITTSDELGIGLTTKYEYTNPNTGQSSGILSYYPYKENSQIQIPYASKLPAPIPTYEYVTQKNIPGTDITNDEYVVKSVYRFNVLDEKNSSEITFGDYFEIDTATLFNSYNSHRDTDVNATRTTIKDNLSSLGQLREFSSYNSLDQLLTKTVNEYYAPDDYSQGVLKESFQTYKEIERFDGTRNKWHLNTVSVTKYPSILKSSSNYSNGIRTESHNDIFDEKTGQLLETTYTSSKGVSMKNKTVLAYSNYENMGSKVDNPTNKNMLSQIAAQYSLANDNGIWKPIGVGITTWKNEWKYYDNFGVSGFPNDPSIKIWRKHKTYVWDGEIDSNGFLVNYNLMNDDGFDWTVPNIDQEIAQIEPWKQISEVSIYDHNSMPLEYIDINGNQATTKMTNNDSKISLTSNAAYGEAFYAGAEYDQGNDLLEAQVYGSSLRSQEEAHTGDYSLKLTPGSEFKWVLKGGTYKEGKYKMSLWVHKGNYLNVRFKTPEGTIESLNGERTFAGDWVQMNHYFDIESLTGSDKNVFIVSNSGDVYMDDFRFHPIESSMTSYVYNQWDELSYVLGANNVATKYVYDEAGRLVKVFQEVVDRPTVIGGFKRVQDYVYNYKRSLDVVVQQDDPCNTPLNGTMTVDVQLQPNPEENNCVTPNCDNTCKLYVMNASITGGCGDSRLYKWQIRSRDHSGQQWPNWSLLNTTNNSSNIMLVDTRPPSEGGSLLCGKWVQFRCVVTEGNLPNLETDPTTERNVNCDCGIE